MSDETDNTPDWLKREVEQERLWRSFAGDLDKLLKQYVTEGGMLQEVACGALVGAAENIGDYLPKVVPLHPAKRRGPSP